MAQTSGKTALLGGVGSIGKLGKLVAAAASTGAALVSIVSFLYSYGVVGDAASHKTVGNFGATWVGLRPAADTAESLGDTLHLAATVTDKNGSVLIGVRPTWSSESPSVAIVGSDGSVVARGPGATTIIAVVGGLTARSRIVVRQRVAVARIAGDSGITLPEGERQTLHVQSLDARGHAVVGRTAQWRVDDSSVVALDSLGTITGRNLGRAIVSATVDGVSAHAPVTVVSVPASLTVLSGVGQRAAAGATLAQPVVVRVTSRRGHPVEGAMVRFRSADGQGNIEPAAALTDADGRARVEWRLGELPGRQTLLAMVDRVDSTLAVIAEADPVPANTRVTALRDDPSGAAATMLAEPVGVRLSDSTGRALPDVPVSWVALDGGSVESLSARTDSIGEVRARWTLGAKAGKQRLRAQVGSGRGVPPFTISAIAIAGEPASIKVVSGDGQHAAAGATLAKPIVVRVTDRTGNAVADAALTLTPSAGSLPDSMRHTDSIGRATIRWTMGHAAGAHTLLVHVGRISEPLRVVARATPAAPANLSFEHPPAQGKAGHRLGTEVVALVTDSYGNPVPDASVSFATRSGTISPKHAVSDAKGRLKVAWTLAAKPGEQTLTGAVRGTDVKGVLVVHAVGSGSTTSVKSASKVEVGGSGRR